MSVTKPGHTKIRHLRIPEAMWAEAADHANAEGKTISELVRDFLREYNAEKRAASHG